MFVDWLRSSIAQFMPAGEELPEMEDLEEVRMTLEERVKEWPAQWLRKGREQGLAQGREQGFEHERALLRRMAALRFGAETGERLAALMAKIADADRLAEVGDRLVRCDDGDEFLAQVATIVRS